MLPKRQKEGILLCILPGSQEDRRFQTHQGSPSLEYMHCLQTILHRDSKELLGLVESGNLFTTVDLKDTYCHIEVAQRQRKFLCFAFQGIAYKYNRRCVEVVQQLL